MNTAHINAHKPKRRKTALIVVIAVVLVLLLIVGTIALLVYSRVEKLIAGADFELVYRVEKTGTESVVYDVMDKMEITRGTIKGRAVSGVAEAELMPQDSDESLADIFVDEDALLINVETIYNYLLDMLLSKHPILGQLPPDWSLGSYISLDQLMVILGADESETSSGGLAIAERKLFADVEDGRSGYIYFDIPVEGQGLSVVAGFSVPTAIRKNVAVQVIVTQEDLGFRVVMSGIVTTVDADAPDAPTSRISDATVDNMAFLVDIVKRFI